MGAVLFVWSFVILLSLGVVLAAVFLFGAYRALRSFRSAANQVTGDITDRTGLIKARLAGLRVAFAERRRGVTG